ncbi:MAG: hypothetical protein FWD38_00145 [Oscillospiraceae bacterium]|nr:hypothetical protein [Oscillospiraceae bacterium]
MFVFAKIFSSKAKRAKKPAPKGRPDTAAPKTKADKPVTNKAPGKLVADSKPKKPVPKTKQKPEPKASEPSAKINPLKVIAVAVAALIALGTPVVVYFMMFAGPVRSVVTIEAGQPMPGVSVFLRNPESEAEFISDTSGITLNKTGDIKLSVKVNDDTFNVTLRVVDTIPPSATAVNQFIVLGESPSVDMYSADVFVTDIIDETNVTVTFEKSPLFKETGKEEIIVILKDEGGNTTKIAVNAYIFTVNEEITIEAGMDFQDINAHILLAEDDELYGVYEYAPVRFERDIPQQQLNTVGQYDVTILFNQRLFPIKITVADTSPPTGVAKHLYTWLGKTHTPLDFIEDAHDFSEFTARYASDPDFSSTGTQEVTIILQDVWGNSSEFSAALTIERDTIPPEIRGARDLTVAQGANILYRTGVTVWDNADGDIDFEVDSSAVEIDVLGEYPVIFSAVDSSGNKSSITITITIVEFTPESVTESIDAVLANIIDNTMDQTEQARAIHTWVRSSISYGAGINERDTYRAAHRGLQRRTGDCYTYFAISSLMLDRVGINNVEIIRIPGARSTNHFWSLIEIDGLWYHFDSTPNIFGVMGFMLTSPEAARVSASSRSWNYYAYDPALYPPVADAPEGTPFLDPQDG